MNISARVCVHRVINPFDSRDHDLFCRDFRDHPYRDSCDLRGPGDRGHRAGLENFPADSGVIHRSVHGNDPNRAPHHSGPDYRIVCLDASAGSDNAADKHRYTSSVAQNRPVDSRRCNDDSICPTVWHDQAAPTDKPAAAEPRQREELPKQGSDKSTAAPDTDCPASFDHKTRVGQC